MELTSVPGMQSVVCLPWGNGGFETVNRGVLAWEEVIVAGWETHSTGRVDEMDTWER